MSTVYETLPQRMRRKILEEFPEAVALYVKDSRGGLPAHTEQGGGRPR